MEITADAYGSSATLTDDALTIRATGKMGRMALFGPDPRSERTIPLTEITHVGHRPPPKMALGSVNGSLHVHTADGAKYELHYRVKKNRDFGALADAVVAAVNSARSA